MIWVAVSVVAVGVVMIAFVFRALQESPIERAKREQVTKIRDRAMRANYELDQASFAARRAIFEAIQQGLQDRDS